MKKKKKKKRKRKRNLLSATFLVFIFHLHSLSSSLSVLANFQLFYCSETALQVATFACSVSWQLTVVVAAKLTGCLSRQRKLPKRQQQSVFACLISTNQPNRLRERARADYNYPTNDLSALLLLLLLLLLILTLPLLPFKIRWLNLLMQAFTVSCLFLFHSNLFLIGDLPGQVQQLQRVLNQLASAFRVG